MGTNGQSSVLIAHTSLDSRLPGWSVSWVIASISALVALVPGE